MTTTTTKFPAILTPSARRLRAVLKRSSTLSKEGIARLTMTMATALTPKEHDEFLDDFISQAHDHQLPPERANSGEDWTIWLILGGRGAGKTRAGTEWVRSVAINDPSARIALVGETEHDAREVMVEGVSGMLAAHRLDERP
jgi:phage terminase large subunit-like protein